MIVERLSKFNFCFHDMSNLRYLRIKSWTKLNRYKCIRHVDISKRVINPNFIFMQQYICISNWKSSYILHCISIKKSCLLHSILLYKKLSSKSKHFRHPSFNLGLCMNELNEIIRSPINTDWRDLNQAMVIIPKIRWNNLR